MNSSTKIVIINSYLLVLMVSVILKMKNIHDSFTSAHIVCNEKSVWKIFCFPIRICLYWLYRAFDGASFEKKSRFSHFPKLRYMHYYVGFSFWVWQKPLTQANRNLLLQFLYSFSWHIFLKKIQNFIIYLSRNIGILADRNTGKFIK